MILRDHHIDDAAVGHVGSRIIVRDDGHPIRAQGTVAVCMVKVPMGIHHVINVTAELSDRGFYLASQFGQLIIDDQDAVCSERHGDIAPQTEQHIKTVGDFFCANLGRVDVPAENLQQGFSFQRCVLLEGADAPVAVANSSVEKTSVEAARIGLRQVISECSREARSVFENLTALC